MVSDSACGRVIPPEFSRSTAHLFDCLYNHLTGSVGKRRIAKEWSKAGITELVPGADLG